MLWLNSMWTDTVGWSSVELQSKSIFEFIHPDDRPKFVSQITSKNPKPGSRQQHELRFEKSDKSYIWLQLNVLVEGHGLFYISVRDVSTKKAIEHEVEEQNRRLSLAEKIGQIGHWHIEMPSGNLDWSDQVYRICGVDPETFDVSQRNAIDLYHPDDRPAVQRMVTAAIENGDDFEFELRIVRPDGEVRQVAANGVCETNDQGDIAAVFGVFQDITDRKRAEKALYDQMIERERLSERLKQLHAISAQQHSDFDALIKDYLKLGNRVFRSNTAIISQINDENYRVFAVESRSGIELGDEWDLGETYCQKVIETNAVITYEHVGENSKMCVHPAYQAMKLESYIGVPVWVEGQVFGTINFSDTRPKKKPYTQSDKEFIILMAQGVGAAIERFQSEQLRKAAKAELEISEQRFKNAFKHAPVGVALVDLTGHWVQVNHSMTRMTGYDEQDLLLKTLDQVTFEGDLTNDAEWKQALLNKAIDSTNVERRLLRSDGETVWTMMGVSLLWQGDQPLHYVMQFVDITDQKRAQEMLEGQTQALAAANVNLQKLSSLDPLTGLLNRRAFDEQKTNIWDDAGYAERPISVMMIDVDNFKTFNDTFGHPAGDVVLKEVANLCQGNARGSDICARFGGEEFVVLLPDANEDVSVAIAERLREKIANHRWEHRDITVSIGLATDDPDGSTDRTIDFAELLEMADQALYRSKESGRNRVSHHADC